MPGSWLVTSCSDKDDDPKVVNVEGVALDQATLSMEVGDAVTLRVTLTPETATNKKMTWSSSNDKVAKVDHEGMVIAVTPGTATITVTAEDGGKTATCAVTVNESVGVTLNKSKLLLLEAETITLQASVVPENASNKKVAWTSADETIATVDADGKVTAVKAGTVNIAVTTEAGGIKEECQVIVVAPVKKIAITAGSFMMGSPENEARRRADEVQHKVTLTKDFFMGETEVTAGQFAAFLNAVGVGEDGLWKEGLYPTERLINAPTATSIEYNTDAGMWLPRYDANSGRTHDENAPAVQVTWFGAAEYARWSGGRLPTEAEWEYACRAGTSTTWSFGNTKNDLPNWAWIRKNSSYKVREVQTTAKKPNPWGLYDTYGLSGEWCADWYGPYAEGDQTDPKGPDSGTKRVWRGGSIMDGLFGNFDQTDLRSASRMSRVPTTAQFWLGFRVAFDK